MNFREGSLLCVVNKNRKKRGGGLRSPAGGFVGFWGGEDRVRSVLSAG